jgi:hypothetical protein
MLNNGWERAFGSRLCGNFILIPSRCAGSSAITAISSPVLQPTHNRFGNGGRCLSVREMANLCDHNPFVACGKKSL